MAELLVAFVTVLVITRILRAGLFLASGRLLRAVAPNLVALLAGTVAGEAEPAGDEPPRFLYAFALYGIPAAALAVYDYVADRPARARKALAEPGAE